VAMPEQSSRRTELAGENAMPSPACFVRLFIDFALVATHGREAAEIEPINYQRFDSETRNEVGINKDIDRQG